MTKIKRKQRHGFGSIVGEERLTILEGTIIASFFPEAEETTIKEIQDRTDYSYERINSALKSLAKKDIATEKQIGKTLVYSLDLHNLYSKIGFSNYMLEREIEFIKKHKLIFKSIEEISKDIFGIIILFGSYSKGNEKNSSDIDLMVVSENKQLAEEKINEIKIKRGYEISLAFIKTLEFPKIKKENPELWADLKQYAIVFNGEDSYYYWMYQDANN